LPPAQVTEFLMEEGAHPACSRRLLLQAALGCALLPAGRAFAAAPQGFFARHHLPIGLQLYTVGDAVRKDLDAAFTKIAGIGFTVLEAAGYHGQTPAALRQAANRHGLKITSIHVSAVGRGGDPGLDGDIPKLAAEMHALGVTDVVMPMFAIPERLGAQREGEGFVAYLGRVAAQLTADDWKRTAALLNEKGTALRREGLRFGYHNHNPEFAPVAGSKGLDILLQETSPETVVFELDVGWAAAAGVDPVALLRRHARRFQLLHVKDIKASTKTNYALQQDPTEVGSGRMNWEQLLPAAWDAGVRKFYVEQEPPFTSDRFEAIGKSFRFLRQYEEGRITA
jgi:sugar phosphate isomerase/epimerase